MLATFPSKQQLKLLLGDNDYFLWEYYGKILGWIFRSRIKVIMIFLGRLKPKPRKILDVGCGPMFISSPLIRTSSGEYVGIDVIPGKILKKYKDVARKLGVQSIEVIRASADSLPLKSGIFDFVLSLDVLEHLRKPNNAVMEINRISKDGSSVIVSLPLENTFQKLSRMGFKFTKPKPFPNNVQDSILKKTINVPITRTPDYHYVGDIDSHDSMYDALKDNFKPIYTRYTPLGFHRSININAVHIFIKK